jgi:hypothetical protein
MATDLQALEREFQALLAKARGGAAVTTAAIPAPLQAATAAPPAACASALGGWGVGRWVAVSVVVCIVLALAALYAYRWYMQRHAGGDDGDDTGDIDDLHSLAPEFQKLIGDKAPSDSGNRVSLQTHHKPQPQLERLPTRPPPAAAATPADPNFTPIPDALAAASA